MEEKVPALLALNPHEARTAAALFERDFFKMLRDHLQEGLFADPAHGGNRGKLGWKLLGHPGIWFENSAEENLSEQPVTKGCKIQSLEDIGYSIGRAPSEP